MNGPGTLSIPARRLAGLAAALVLAACTTTTPTPTVGRPGAPTVLYAWVEQGDHHTASARAILPAGGPCPAITVDGSAKPMKPRTTSPPNFTEVQVCEHSLSAKNPPTSLAIGSLTLPPPTTRADHILVLGDTGCRKKGSTQQDCDGDPATGAWGFPKISQEAAATRPTPDLILHVGDYLYRESGCDLCGYKWTTWQADFFQAAEAGGLLRQAPWIFVRGNHEDCNRAWHGYFLFLAPGPWTAPTWPDSACPASVAPFRVALDGLDIYVVDTSSEDAQLAQQSFATVNGDLAGSTTDSWLTTHVPVCDDFDCDGDMGQAFAASGLNQASLLKWLHVGHIHLFEQIDGDPGVHPPQTTTGGSGTQLDSSSHCAVGPQIYCDVSGYTYLMVASQTAAWQATLYDLGGQPQKTFTIAK